MTRYSVAAWIALLLPSAARAQSPSAASMDSLLGRLEGRWRMVGTVRGRPVSYDMDAARVLRGRFVELHLEDIARPSQYEGRVFVGVDSAGGRYLAHWLDSFGAAASIPHAVGEQRGDTLILRFAYSSATFRDTFVYHRREDRWRFLIEAEDPAAPGGWRTFGDYDVRRR